MRTTQKPTSRRNPGERDGVTGSVGSLEAISVSMRFGPFLEILGAKACSGADQPTREARSSLAMSFFIRLGSADFGNRIITLPSGSMM